jgi:cobalt-zinc-cadmium efflux system outer membrane protein
MSKKILPPSIGPVFLHRSLRFSKAPALLCLCLLTTRAFAQTRSSPLRIDLDQAIQLALEHNHALKGTRTLIQQSQAQEVTAGLRPNPLLTSDYTFLPIFSPSVFSLPLQQNPLPEQFDAGISFTTERGHKRQARLLAARDQTAVTHSLVRDTERRLTFAVAQQFIAVLLAKSNLQVAEQDLAGFEQIVKLGQERYKAGAISEGDLLKIRLQLLQFQTDVSSAQLALVQARASLRQLVGYDAVPENYDVGGELTYTPLRGNKEDFQTLALQQRPDLIAAQQGIKAAQSQYQLAKANAKRDLTTAFEFSRVAGVRAADFALNIEIPIFNRNQGEIARTQHAMTQAQETSAAASESVMTDVANAYEALKTHEQVVQLYVSGYLKQAQDLRDISEYAYRRGAASLLDFLDAERSYRATGLAYRQSLAGYMLSLEQLRQAVGTRSL